jgi:hypothetical protein
MAAGSPMATPEPGAAGKPAQSLVFLRCRARPKAGRLHSLPRCQNYGPRRQLRARLSGITRARRWLMLGYQGRIWLRERVADQGDGGGDGEAGCRVAVPGLKPRPQLKQGGRPGETPYPVPDASRRPWALRCRAGTQQATREGPVRWAPALQRIVEGTLRCVRGTRVPR